MSLAGLGHESSGHVGELRLRRFRAGELLGADREEVAQHTADCGSCRARLRGLDDEQRQFERAIPFDRFAGGVERARRVPRVNPRRAWTMGALGFAAAAALLLVWRPLTTEQHAGNNRIKGGVSTEAAARIASADGHTQRAANEGGVEALQAGERVRLGYLTDEARYLVALSLDDAGTVTPLYPEGGTSLRVEPQRALTYLPDSLEFTGQGRERVFLLLSDRPLAVTDVEDAARAAHARSHGDLAAITEMPLEGRGKVAQFTWLFGKP